MALSSHPTIHTILVLCREPARLSLESVRDAARAALDPLDPVVEAVSPSGELDPATHARAYFPYRVGDLLRGTIGDFGPATLHDLLPDTVARLPGPVPAHSALFYADAIAADNVARPAIARIVAELIGGSSGVSSQAVVGLFLLRLPEPSLTHVASVTDATTQELRSPDPFAPFRIGRPKC